MRHQMTGPGEDAGRIELLCDADGCAERFTIRGFSTARTRIQAQAQGWAGAGIGDYCPAHSRMPR